MVGMKTELLIRFFSNLNRLFYARALNAPYVFILPINLNLNHPTAHCFIPANTCNATDVVGPFRAVFHVHFSRDISKVFNSIIHAVPIDVIDFKSWKFSFFDKPNQSMVQVIFAAKPETQVFISVLPNYASRPIPNLYSIARGLFPEKLSGCLSVLKNIKQVVWGDPRRFPFSHCHMGAASI